jgi:putative hemolysin
VGWARTAAEVAQAQRLRHRVFAREMGARLHALPGAPEGHDVDALDRHCHHLLVRAGGPGAPGDVIATCRVLTPANAVRAGGLYTACEFDLAPLQALLPRTLEMGRVCIDPAWRHGVVVMALWRALGVHVAREGLEAVIGCCSVSLRDGGELASMVWHELRPVALVAPHERVTAVRPYAFTPAGAAPAGPARLPALMKGYLRCGGRLLGAPAHDEHFNVADFPMLLRIADMPRRYEKRIFGA